MPGRFEKRFTASRITSDYMDVYTRLADSRMRRMNQSLESPMRSFQNAWLADDKLRGLSEREFRKFQTDTRALRSFATFPSCSRCKRTVLTTSESKQKRKGKVKGIMNLETLKELYVSELRDLYNAENQLVKALPKMAKGASSDELKEAFEKHLEQTKGHVQRLEEVFEELGEKTKGKTCQAMKGLIEEGSEILKADGEDSVIDAGIIVAAQKVEHYEIAGYGSVRTFAQLLGQDKSAELLQETLDEESEANELLNKLAEDIVNPEALMEPEMASASLDR
jgi:ferritin-like metal-binding protein YciE